jgi:transposase
LIKQYTRLTDPQWEAISPFLDTKRKRRLNLRDILDGIFYILRTGCQWRNLPDSYPNWQSVFWYFSKWKKGSTFSEINIALNKIDRKNEGRNENPAIFSIDSQSVKLSPMICEDRGLDAHKKVNGRKRQLIVDSGGRLWFATVHAANIHDGAAALGFLPDIICQDERLSKIYGDQSYAGVFAEQIEKHGVKFEKAARPESTVGFVPVAKRWVVERTIAWSNFFRRIVKDYEYTVSSSIGWMFLANIQIMLQRIHPNDKT